MDNECEVGKEQNRQVGILERFFWFVKRFVKSSFCEDLSLLMEQDNQNT